MDGDPGETVAKIRAPAIPHGDEEFGGASPTSLVPSPAADRPVEISTLPTLGLGIPAAR